MNSVDKVLTAVLFAALTMGCGAPQEAGHETGPAPSTTSPSPVAPSEGFSWILDDELAAMPLPGRNRTIDEDAAFLEQEGIRVLVSLTEEPPDGDVLASRGIRQKHLPVRDFTPPTLQQMMEFAELVDLSAGDAQPVGVHCTAGLGRSGTMSAVYLVAKGATAEEAIARVRELRPGSVETPEQEAAVREFAEALRTRN